MGAEIQVWVLEGRVGRCEIYKGFGIDSLVLKISTMGRYKV